MQVKMVGFLFIYNCDLLLQLLNALVTAIKVLWLLNERYLCNL